MTAAVTPDLRRPGRAGGGCDSLRYVACSSRYANFALHAMHAHRLWIKLWISLGHPAENRSHLVGKPPVTRRGRAAAHSRAARSTRADHRACARLRQPRPARTLVIPGIHRPYDDYQSRYAARSNPSRFPPEKEGDR